MNNENLNSGVSPTPTPSFSAPTPTTPAPKPASPSKPKPILGLVTLLLLVVLVAGTGVMYMGQTSSDKKLTALKTKFDAYEANNTTNFDKVESDTFQAVFLENGQVYFGKITSISNTQITLENIYYLKTGSTQVTKDNVNNPPNDISLVKLGCELHKPQDKMYIERKQTSFWENLKADGQVAKAIDAYVKQNPTGQKC